MGTLSYLRKSMTNVGMNAITAAADMTYERTTLLQLPLKKEKHHRATISTIKILIHFEAI